MKVSFRAAEIGLAELIDAALAGEEVLIAKDDRAVVKLVAVPPTTFKIGMLEGKFGEGPDFFEPMSGDELDLWEGSR